MSQKYYKQVNMQPTIIALNDKSKQFVNKKFSMASKPSQLISDTTSQNRQAVEYEVEKHRCSLIEGYGLRENKNKFY